MLLEFFKCTILCIFCLVVFHLGLLSLFDTHHEVFQRIRSVLFLCLELLVSDVLNLLFFGQFSLM